MNVFDLTAPAKFLCFAVLALLCKFDGKEETDTPASEAKPNIVLLLTDDQSFRALHALGNNEIRTPAMDRLVANGTTFTHAYNMGGWNGAICIASRAMMISGRSIWRARQISESYAKKERIEETWPKLMEHAGYDTYMTGKWHVPFPPELIFNHVKSVLPGMPGDTPEGYNRPKSLSDTLWKPWKEEFGGYWEGGLHWSELVRNNALEFISTAAENDDPFFMYIAFNAPHDPRQSPKSFVDQYPLDEVSVPENFVPEYQFAAAMGAGPDLRDEALAPFPRTEHSIKVNRQEYYALTTHLDKQIEQIISALKQSGLLENTYIFLTSDHGLAIGEHGLLGKQNMFDHSVRVPFVLVGPGISKDKKVDCDIYLQDAMATSLELAGVKKPGYVDFNSVLSLAKGIEKRSCYPAIYGSYRLEMQRMIRKDGYKLIVYPAIGKLLLFDLAADPLEIKDISGVPEHRARVKTLLHELLALQQSLEDPLEITPADYL